jgi:multidrug efflux pump subunit AcrB
MNFFEFPVKKPVTIIMGALITLIIGCIALWKMPMELIPRITFPT